MYTREHFTILHKRQQGMRSAHLIKEIEDTIKRGPKSNSGFPTVNSHMLGWLKRGAWPDGAASPSAQPCHQNCLKTQFCISEQPNSSVLLLLHWIKEYGLEVRLTHHYHHLARVTSGTASTSLVVQYLSILGVRCVLLPLPALKKKKKKGGGKQSKHYLLLITCKVGLLPLPQFLRALKWNLKEATHCFPLCKSQEQIGLKLQLWKATGNWQPGNLLPTIQGNKGYIPPQVVTIRNPRLIYLVRPTE